MKGPGAADLSAMLAGDIGSVAAHLLPAGRRDGPHWRCGGVDGSPGQSLAVHISGSRAGIWHDFATGESGDALDLVASVLFRGSKKDAMDWARRWLNVEAGKPVPPPRRPPEAVQRSDQAEAEARQRKALALFLSGAAAIRDTPAAYYLEARGITFDDLARQPGALRFHPEVWCSEIAKPLPAMLAAITAAQGAHVGTHRTWLAQDAGGVWRKAPLRDPKKTLGPYAGGFIPVARGMSGRPMREAPEGDAVAVAEGIETALSVAIACPSLRVIAAVALPNMGRINLPPAVSRVILCADNDDDNPKAGELLHRAANRFASEGREVRIARPPIGKDFNDTLRAESLA